MISAIGDKNGNPKGKSGYNEKLERFFRRRKISG